MWQRVTEMVDEPHEVVGWVGMLLILAAYAGVSLSMLSADAIAYKGMNALGAATLIYSSYKTRNYPVIALNIAWLGIAVVALL